ncbi:MAG: uncharacterized protein A8A55_1861, partial [Amphiamblys sp. WSBS2006]
CIPEILKDGGSACSFPGCKNDNLLKEIFGNIIEQHNGGARVCPLTIDLLTLTIPGRWPNQVLLHLGTVVTLENIALSDALLFKLLKKTHVVVGENVSVFGNFKGEDCIRAGMNTRKLGLLRPAFFPEPGHLFGENEVCFVKNIARMPNNSIKLGKVGRLKLWNNSFRIFPKLKLHEENVIEELSLEANEKKYLSEIDCVADNSIWLGKTKRLVLFNYSINILPKLMVHEEGDAEVLYLDAGEINPLSEKLLEGSKNVCVRKFKRMEVCNCSVNVFFKLVLNKEMELLSMVANRKEHVSGIMGAKNNSIRFGKVKRLKLSNYSIKILLKLKLYEEYVMEELVLNAPELEHVSGILYEALYITRTGILYKANNDIYIGKVENLMLRDYSINILPKLKLHEGNVMEKFHLSAYKTEHISEILCAADNSIRFGKVKRLERD